MMYFIIFYWNFPVFKFSQLAVTGNHSFHFRNICHCVLCKPTLKPQMAAFGIHLFNIGSLQLGGHSHSSPSQSVSFSISPWPSYMIHTEHRKTEYIYTRIMSLLSQPITQTISGTLLPAQITLSKAYVDTEHPNCGS